MEIPGESSFAPAETRVYRFNRVYRLYHLAAGAAFFVVALTLYRLPPVAFVLALFALFMIARPFVSAVTVDPFSVTYRGTFSAKSIQRSAITAVETKSTGRGSVLILWGNYEKKERLAIPAIFGFDDAWNDWLSSYRDLSGDKPLSLF